MLPWSIRSRREGRPGYICARTPGDVDAAISVVTLTELHFGVLLPLTTTSGRAAPIASRLWSRPSILFPSPHRWNGVALLTYTIADFAIMADLVDVRLPVRAVE